MQYLKDEQYYFDLYDLHTIQECLRMISSFSESTPPELSTKKLSKEQENVFKRRIAEVVVYYIKGDRYRNRSAAINLWIDKDRKRQEKEDDTLPPTDINCDFCVIPMKSVHKSLHHFDEPLRVLFFFDCPKCNKSKAYFDNGERYIPKPDLCEKCGSEVKRSHSQKGEVYTTITKCTSCDFVEKEVDDFKKSREESEEKEKQERALLKKYRAKFCMSDEEGGKYASHIIQLEQIKNMEDERKRKTDDPRYAKAKQLKKIPVLELEKLLAETLYKLGYANLQFDKPELERFVIVPFTVQEVNSKRSEYDSRNGLRRIIKDLLEKTNWRLMSEGVNYRLGYLKGKLKGYEREDDLVKLVS